MSSYQDSTCDSSLADGSGNGGTKPTRHLIVSKRGERSRPRVVSVDDPCPSAPSEFSDQNLTSTLQGLFDIATSVAFSRGHEANVGLEAFPSPRLGAHAFSVDPDDPTSVETIRQLVEGRDDSDAILHSSADLLRRPHRFNARFEIDGDKSIAPAIAATSACRKLESLVRLLAAHPTLAPFQADCIADLRDEFERKFVPYFSGNRSLHLLPLGASDVGTRFSEGMAGLCDRINAVAGKEIGIEESLVDAQPHTRVTTPTQNIGTLIE